MTSRFPVLGSPVTPSRGHHASLGIVQHGTGGIRVPDLPPKKPENTSPAAASGRGSKTAESGWHVAHIVARCMLACLDFAGCGYFGRLLCFFLVSFNPKRYSSVSFFFFLFFSLGTLSAWRCLSAAARGSMQSTTTVGLRCGPALWPTTSPPWRSCLMPARTHGPKTTPVRGGGCVWGGDKECTRARMCCPSLSTTHPVTHTHRHLADDTVTAPGLFLYPPLAGHVMS